MPVDVLDQYPVLKHGIEVHLYPVGGALFVAGAPVDISEPAAEFLSRCDGAHPLRSIFPSGWNRDWQDLRFIAFMAVAVNRGWISLLDAPARAEIRVTGSRTAFFPPHMSVELTEACNLRCDYCYRDSDATKTAHMPVSELLSILDRLREAGLRSVELTGGEPLMHGDFARILEYCGEHFALTGVLTNGTLLLPALDPLLARLGDRLMLSVSLDASTAAAHDSRRGVPGAFAKTTANLARMSALGLNFRVSMVVDDRNFADIENTLLLARSLGARAFSYTPALPLGRGAHYAPSVWKFGALDVAQIEADLAARYKGFLGVLSEQATCEIEGEEGCGAGYRTYAMDPWGNVRPCPTFGSSELVFGNLRTQSLRAVFEHPATLAMRKLRTPSPSFCGECSSASYCRYCSLRGLHSSLEHENCTWLAQPALAEILPVWKAPSPPPGSTGA